MRGYFLSLAPLDPDDLHMLLGPYRLLSHAGSGRDGAAYLALREPELEPVEVWVLSPARASESWPEVVRRLRLAALLEHTALRAVIHFEADAGTPYLALEPDDSPRLEAILSPGQALPVWEVLEMAGQMIEALSVTHRVGLVHGRLTPSEIGWDPRTRRVRLDPTRLAVRHSPPALFPGIEQACTAPELSGGHRANTAADVYSLGVLVHFLLTGQIPLPGLVADVQDVFAKELLAWAGSLRRPEPEDRPATQEALLNLPHPTWSTGGRVSHPESVLHAIRGTSRVLVEASPDPNVPDAVRELSSRCAPNGDTTRRSPSRRSTAQVPVVRVPADRDPVLDALVEAARPTETVHLGRFRLESLLGEGGLGRVFRATDLADDSTVAVKVLHPHLLRQQHAVRRFRKEARLLAEVRSPRIANLLEAGEENGIHFLVLEFVQGHTLADLLRHKGQLSEEVALALAIEIAQALAEPHRLGIIHRDIKPENMMLVGGDALRVSNAGDLRTLRLKLLDFGLARHVLENGSLEMTREGSVLGSVLYMAPEQARDSTRCDCRADVYALGCTLYHMLTGKPPFQGDSPLEVQIQHASNPVPPLRALQLPLSEMLVQIVERCLAKRPEERFANAAELLAALERLQRGETTTLATHPRRPPHRANRRTLVYQWTFDMQASPETLWPLVARTDRLNQALGLAAPTFISRPDWRGGSQVFAEATLVGMAQRWREHPFEWVEGHRHGVLREYSRGLFHWLCTTLTLHRNPQGGTTLEQRIEVEPRGWLGRCVANLEFGFKGQRAARRVFQRIDRFLATLASGTDAHLALVDPFTGPTVPTRPQRRRLDEMLQRLSVRGIDPFVLDRLGDWLAQAPAQRLGRIRPLVLALELDVDPDALVAALLHGARDGLFRLHWELLCPTCWGVADVKEALRHLDEQGHCATCNLDFPVDFAASVEMIAAVHPSIRPGDTATYCVGGPFQVPHVVAQVRLRASEPLQLEVALSEGLYLVRGPQLPQVIRLRVHPDATAQRVEIPLRPNVGLEPAALRPGRQQIVLVNNHPREVLVRLEGQAPREGALTAVRASSLSLFRALFPQEVLGPGKLAAVSEVGLLAVRLVGTDAVWGQLGDGPAYTLLQELLGKLEELVRREGGAVVQTDSRGGLAAFSDPLAAVRAATLAPASLALGNEVSLCIAVHRGPALAVTFNDRLGYFGATVRQVEELAGGLVQGGTLLSQPVVEDAAVIAYLRQRALRVELAPMEVVPDGVGIPHLLVAAEGNPEAAPC